MKRSGWPAVFGALCAWALYAAPCHVLAFGVPERLFLGWLAVQAKRFLEMPGLGILHLMHPDTPPMAESTRLTALCILAALAVIGALAGLALSRLARSDESEPEPGSAGGVPPAVALALSLAGGLFCGYALGLAGAWLALRARPAGKLRTAALIVGIAAAIAWTLLLVLPSPQNRYAGQS